MYTSLNKSIIINKKTVDNCDIYLALENFIFELTVIIPDKGTFTTFFNYTLFENEIGLKMTKESSPKLFTLIKDEIETNNECVSFSLKRSHLKMKLAYFTNFAFISGFVINFNLYKNTRIVMDQKHDAELVEIDGSFMDNQLQVSYCQKQLSLTFNNKGVVYKTIINNDDLEEYVTPSYKLQGYEFIRICNNVFNHSDPTWISAFTENDNLVEFVFQDISDITKYIIRFTLEKSLDEIPTSVSDFVVVE